MDGESTIAPLYMSICMQIRARRLFLSVCLHVYEAVCACKQNEVREFWWKRWLCNRLSNHKRWELN